MDQGLIRAALTWLVGVGRWSDVGVRGVWRYQENTGKGRRRALRANTGGYSPIAARWLRGDGPLDGI